MIDVTFTFNGYDFSSKLSTYTVTHEVEVSDTVVALNGYEYVATRIRPTISFSLIPMSESDVAAVYNALKVLSANATYTNPNTGTTETAEMRVATNLNAVFGLSSIDGNRYYKGDIITLRQRSVL